MNKMLIDGYKKIENDFGYWPSFHDATIDKIEISSEGITFYIAIETIPEGMTSYPILKLIFFGVEKYCLEGEIYGCASIIFDMEIDKVNDYFKTQITSSLGAHGTIYSKKIQIEYE
jgi:hypothetical protein